MSSALKMDKYVIDLDKALDELELNDNDGKFAMSTRPTCLPCLVCVWCLSCLCVLAVCFGYRFDAYKVKET